MPLRVPPLQGLRLAGLFARYPVNTHTLRLLLPILAVGVDARFAVGQAAPGNPQINVPYRCANGITYTILVCKPFGADQWCQWREDQNGQTVTTVNSTWSSMTGRLQGSAGPDTAGASKDVRPLPATDDPGQLAIRRCAEPGGTMLGCIGTGMGTDMGGMMGVNLSTLGHSYKARLVIFGTYTAASGLSFGFSDSSVNIGGCGRMVQGAHNYTVTAAGGKYTLNIANTPQPLIVALGPDGRIAGPAAQDITGQQVTGYNVVTNLRTGMEVSRTPIYGPITVHCNVGTLTPGPPTDPSPASASVASGIITVMQNLTGTASSTTQQQLLLPPGPRMAGTFGGSGGLRIQFSDANAVIDCAQAHVRIAYEVANQAGGAVIRLQNGSNPFSLKVQSDGSLAVAGTVTVNGKLMIGMRGSDPVFNPTTATCPGNALVAASHP